MKNVLILGAGGQIARHVIDFLAKDPDIRLTLFLRKANKLSKTQSAHARVIAGDVMEAAQLKEAVTGQDVVYANLSGEMDKLTTHIVIPDGHRSPSATQMRI